MTALTLPCLLVLMSSLGLVTTSEVSFTSTATSIQSLLTEHLSMTCSINSTAASLGIVGKRDEVTTSDISFLSSLIIAREGQDLATITEHFPASGYGNTGEIVSGQVIGDTSAYLTVDWTYPNTDHLGNYTCTVVGLDARGHPVTTTKSLTISQREVTTNDLLQYIHRIKTQDIPHLEATIQQLQTTNNQQTNLINAIKQKQDTKVLFTAELTSPKTVNPDELLVFNNLLTSVGGGYNTSSGQFVCSIPGYYVFHVHIINQHDSMCNFRLTQNGSITAGIFADNNGDTRTGAITVYLHLGKGDVVAVKSVLYTSYVRGDGDYNKFSGELVAMD